MKRILKEKILTKIRRLITLVKSSNIVYLHSLKVIHKLELDTDNFIKDFKVRWNTTYLMLPRFCKLKDVANELSKTPEIIVNIKV